MAAPDLLQRLTEPTYDDILDAALSEYRRTVADELLILAECQRLEQLEPLHVGGQWYPARSRQFARKALAAKHVREAAHVRFHRRLVDAARATGARHCVWCHTEVTLGQECEALAGRLIHVEPCAREFDRWTYTRPLALATEG